MIRVLFVCTGNICRSPTAEGVFRHLTHQAGLSSFFDIDSAGTASGHIGDPPDPRSIAMARKHGISIETQRARALKAEDFETFDYIFAMDNSHFREMQRRAPIGIKARLSMFLESGEVGDPWYGDEKHFTTAYNVIEKGAQDLLNKLKQDHGL